MAVPIKSAAHIPATSPMNSPPRTLDFLLSEAVSNRSREVIQVPQGAVGLWTGSFVTAAGAAGEHRRRRGHHPRHPRLLDEPDRRARQCDRHRARCRGDRRLPAVRRCDPVAVATQLATVGIIVRPGVLKNVQGATFAPDVPPSGPPVSGIQSVEPAPPPEGGVQTGSA